MLRRLVRCLAVDGRAGSSSPHFAGSPVRFAGDGLSDLEQSQEAGSPDIEQDRHRAGGSADGGVGAADAARLAMALLDVEDFDVEVQGPAG